MNKIYSCRQCKVSYSYFLSPEYRFWFSYRDFSLYPWVWFCEHIFEAETKLPPYRRRHFQMHFLKWICVNFRWRFYLSLFLRVPSHYLNQCWIIVNWKLMNKLQWNLKRNSYIFIQENAFENIVCEMAAIFSRPQCVKLVPIMAIANQRQAIISTNDDIFVVGLSTI